MFLIVYKIKDRSSKDWKNLIFFGGGRIFLFLSFFLVLLLDFIIKITFKSLVECFSMQVVSFLLNSEKNAQICLAVSRKTQDRSLNFDALIYPKNDVTESKVRLL